MNEITVLVPIKVPEGIYCWEFNKYICAHYDHEPEYYMLSRQDRRTYLIFKENQCQEKEPLERNCMFFCHKEHSHKTALGILKPKECLALREELHK